MNTIQALLPIFRVFQLICLSPIAIIAKKLKIYANKSLAIYSSLHIGLRIAIFLYTLLSDSLFIRRNDSRIVATIDTVLICGVRLLEILIWLEALIKRQHQVKFLENLLEIDEIFRNCLYADLKYDQLRRRAFIKLIVWIGTFLTIEGLIIALTYKNTTTVHFYYCLIYLLPFFVSSLTYFQIIICVDLIRYRFRVLKHIISIMDNNEQPFTQEINNIVAEPNYFTRKVLKTLFNSDFGDKIHANFDSTYEIHVFERFAIIRNLYFRLWEQTNLINERFQWSMVVNIGNDFSSLLANIYWMLMCMLNNSICQDMSITASFMCVIINVLHVFMLSKVCHNTVVEASNVAYAVHHINFVANSPKLSAFVRINTNE